MQHWGTQHIPAFRTCNWQLLDPLAHPSAARTHHQQPPRLWHLPVQCQGLTPGIPCSPLHILTVQCQGLTASIPCSPPALRDRGWGAVASSAVTQ